MQTTLEARPEHCLVPDGVLRERLLGTIGQLEHALESGMPVEPGGERRGRVLPVGPGEIRRELRFLRQVSHTLALGSAEVWYDRAGLGSVLFVQDTHTGYERFYRLMDEPLHPLDASQVALRSPVGSVLRGRRRGCIVRLDGPHHPRHLRIVTLRTLPARLGMAPDRPDSLAGDVTE